MREIKIINKNKKASGDDGILVEPLKMVLTTVKESIQHIWKTEKILSHKKGYKTYVDNKVC